MQRLIDADELIAKEAVTVHCTNGAIADVVPVGVIRYAPTIDPVCAAGGCYCWECEYHGCADGPMRQCDITDDNDFCSHGERREGEENDD